MKHWSLQRSQFCVFHSSYTDAYVIYQNWADSEHRYDYGWPSTGFLGHHQWSSGPAICHSVGRACRHQIFEAHSLGVQWGTKPGLGGVWLPIWWVNLVWGELTWSMRWVNLVWYRPLYPSRYRYSDYLRSRMEHKYGVYFITHILNYCTVFFYYFRQPTLTDDEPTRISQKKTHNQLLWILKPKSNIWFKIQLKYRKMNQQLFWCTVQLNIVILKLPNKIFFCDFELIYF